MLIPAELRHEIAELFISVQSLIRDAKINGDTVIDFHLPNNFNPLINLSLADIQLIIYSQLIEKVKKLGYTVNIINRSSESVLRIKLPALLNTVDKYKMLNIINAHLITE